MAKEKVGKKDDKTSPTKISKEVFRIPNEPEIMQGFVEEMRSYLNTKAYTIRMRGRKPKSGHWSGSMMTHVPRHDAQELAIYIERKPEHPEVVREKEEAYEYWMMRTKLDNLELVAESYSKENSSLKESIEKLKTQCSKQAEDLALAQANANTLHGRLQTRGDADKQIIAKLDKELYDTKKSLVAAQSDRNHWKRQSDKQSEKLKEATKGIKDLAAWVDQLLERNRALHVECADLVFSLQETKKVAEANSNRNERW